MVQRYICITMCSFVLVFMVWSFCKCATEIKMPMPRLEVGKPIVHQNLAVFPVKILSPTHKADVLTLKEAQQKNLVIVRELPNATVSQVLVENKSNKPILLIGGEVILGGKQDRIISHDYIVPPKETATVKVYCVEPGRWVPQEQGEKFDSAPSVAASEIRKSAQVENSQQSVWHQNAMVQSEISQNLRSRPSQVPNERTQLQLQAPQSQMPQSQAPQSSESYRQVLTDADVQKETDPYIRAIKSHLLKDTKVCGIIVAVNGKIEWLDVFNDPSLFRKIAPSLLHSAAIQALAKRSQAKSLRAPSMAEAKAFLEQTKRSQRKTVELKTKHIRRERVENRSIVGFNNIIKPVSGKLKTAPLLHMNSYLR